MRSKRQPGTLSVREEQDALEAVVVENGADPDDLDPRPGLDEIAEG